MGLAAFINLDDDDNDDDNQSVCGIQAPIQHILNRFGDDSFQAVSGSDGQIAIWIGI